MDMIWEPVENGSRVRLPLFFGWYRRNGKIIARESTRGLIRVQVGRPDKFEVVDVPERFIELIEAN